MKNNLRDMFDYQRFENSDEKKPREENQRIRQTLDALMLGYVSILSGDLITGKCEFLKLGDRLSGRFGGGRNLPPWDVLLESYINQSVWDADREMVRTIMDREYLKNRLKPGQSITREYRNDIRVPGEVKIIRANERNVLFGFNEMDEEKANLVDLDKRYHKCAERLKVVCFGSFKVFINEEPLIFERKKTKELFAYLIDRAGDTCNSEEIIRALWETEDVEKHKSYLRTLIHDLRTKLAEVGMSEVIVRNHRQLSVRKALLDCDYYRMLEGDSEASKSFQGEYMTQYSWAEQTVGRLSFMKKKM